MEYFEKKKLTNKKRVSYLFAFFAICTIAWLYEIVEWIYAVLGDPDAGIAFLWSQWDIWDAQKDMLADASGAIIALFIYAICKTKK